jgi:hypothetical protein
MSSDYSNLKKLIETKKQELADYERLRDDFKERSHKSLVRRQELERNRGDMELDEFRREFDDAMERFSVYGHNANLLNNDIKIKNNAISKLEQELSRLSLQK